MFFNTICLYVSLSLSLSFFSLYLSLTPTPSLSRANKVGIDLAAELNVSAPITMTQRDVPGATRGIVPLLTKAGVQAYAGGVNTASLPPNVPRTFVWHDEQTSTEILAMVHPHGYGGISVSDCVVVDGEGDEVQSRYRMVSDR